MNRAIWMATAFACATAVVAAQTPSTTPSRADDKTVTVTGCLEAASTATSTTAAGATASSGFILANAMSSASTSASSSSAAGTTATAGTTGTTGTVARGTSYVLEGHDADLKSHVGHKIEVTGTVEPKSKAGAAAEPTPGVAVSRAMDSDRLMVSSVKMIAAECTAK